MKKTFAALLLGATFLTGCGDSFQDEFVINNTNGVIVAPVCVDDAYAVNSNTTLTVNAATGVLANDTPNGATLTFQAASANAGTVAGNADGSFTYTPAVNFTGADSFTYTLTNTSGQVTCTVNITVNAVNGFFVDAANGNDGTGNFTNGQPFATIQAAATAAPAGSDIVVRAGSYTGAVNLENGDRLLGAGSVLAQGAAVRPTLTGPVVLGDGCTVDFIRVDGTAGDAIDGNGQNGGTVTNCEIANTTAGGSNGSGVRVDPAAGTWNISNNTITNVAGIGVDVCTVNSDSATFTVNSNTITGGLGSMGFASENSSQLIAQINDNDMSGSTLNAFEVFSFATSAVCLDMENNTNDDEYVFDRSATATLELADGVGFAGNTGAIDNGSVFEDATSANDGACGF